MRPSRPIKVAQVHDVQNLYPWQAFGLRNVVEQVQRRRNDLIIRKVQNRLERLAKEVPAKSYLAPIRRNQREETLRNRYTNNMLKEVTRYMKRFPDDLDIIMAGFKLLDMYGRSRRLDTSVFLSVCAHCILLMLQRHAARQQCCGLLTVSWIRAEIIFRISIVIMMEGANTLMYSNGCWAIDTSCSNGAWGHVPTTPLVSQPIYAAVCFCHHLVWL